MCALDWILGQPKHAIASIFYPLIEKKESLALEDFIQTDFCDGIILCTEP